MTVVHAAALLRPFAVCGSFDASERHTRRRAEVTCGECERRLAVLAERYPKSTWALPEEEGKGKGMTMRKRTRRARRWLASPAQKLTHADEVIIMIFLGGLVLGAYVRATWYTWVYDWAGTAVIATCAGASLRRGWRKRKNRRNAA